MVVGGGEGDNSMETLFVGEVAKEESRRLGRDVTPREITDLFGTWCPRDGAGGGRPILIGWGGSGRWR